MLDVERQKSNTIRAEMITDMCVKTVMEKFSRGIFFELQMFFFYCAVDRPFSGPFCPNLRFCFCTCRHAWTPGVERRPRRCPVRVLARRHEARAFLHRLALRAALVHRRPGPCNARDALGAHGSRRDLSRARARHTAPHFCFSRFFHLQSRSVCHGPLRQQALFRTRLALFRDISLFLGGHFGSEVSCGGFRRIVGVASWRRALFNSHTRYIHMVLPFPVLSNTICLLCPAPSRDQQPSPPWSWHPSLGHDGGLCDVDQHILSGFLQLQVSYQAMYLPFARVVDVENDELRVSVLFACSSVRYSGIDELRVCLVFLLFRSAPNEFFSPL